MSRENGKSSKGLIISLILIIICLVGYIVYTSLDNGKVVDGNKATNNLVNKNGEESYVTDNSNEVNNNQVNNDSQDEPNCVPINVEDVLVNTNRKELRNNGCFGCNKKRHFV